MVAGRAGAPYEPGLLFLREGPALEAAVRGLQESPDVLFVNGTGLDHPRGAGLALHLGALLGLPTVGVTHRPLCAQGSWPDDRRGDVSPLVLRGEVVGYWLRTRSGARPLAVHAPEPLRLASQAALAGPGVGVAGLREPSTVGDRRGLVHRVPRVGPAGRRLLCHHSRLMIEAPTWEGYWEARQDPTVEHVLASE